MKMNKEELENKDPSVEWFVEHEKMWLSMTKEEKKEFSYIPVIVKRKYNALPPIKQKEVDVAIWFMQ